VGGGGTGGFLYSLPSFALPFYRWVLVGRTPSGRRAIGHGTSALCQTGGGERRLVVIVPISMSSGHG
jgi:hypothetical protein